MTKIRFLGVAGYEIECPNGRILMDPFLTGNPLAPCTPDELESPDLILVSHAAFDHMGDAAAIALRSGAPVVCGADVGAILLDQGVPASQIRRTIWGVVVEVAGFQVRPIECHHWSSGKLRDGTVVTGVPLAFLVETEPGVRVYHYGDTAIFDMSMIGELYQPNVGLIGCTVPAELTVDDGAAGRVISGELMPSEAARVVKMLGLNVAIASHYLAINSEVDEFIALVGSSTTALPLAPKVGESFVTDGQGAKLEVTA